MFDEAAVVIADNAADRLSVAEAKEDRVGEKTISAISAGNDCDTIVGRVA